MRNSKGQLLPHHPPLEGCGRPKDEISVLDIVKRLSLTPNNSPPAGDAPAIEWMVWTLLHNPAQQHRVAAWLDRNCRENSGSSLQVDAGGVTVVFKTVGGPATSEPNAD